MDNNVIKFKLASEKLLLKKVYRMGYEHAKSRNDNNYIYDREFIERTSSHDYKLNVKLYKEWNRGYDDFKRGVYKPIKEKKEEDMMVNHINELESLTNDDLEGEDLRVIEAAKTYQYITSALPEERKQCVGCTELRHFYDSEYIPNVKRCELTEKQANCELNSCSETIHCIDLFVKEEYLQLLEYVQERERGDY